MPGSRSTSSAGQTGAAGDVPAVLRPAVILAGAGAVLILLNLLGAPGRAAGLLAAVAGTVLAAPYAERPGAAANGWWNLLAVGSLLALGGTALALGVESLGGLMAVVGGGLIAVGAALGYPARGD